MKDIEFQQDIDELLARVYESRDLWEISRDEVSDAINIITNAYNKKELDSQVVSRINRHPLSRYVRDSMLKYMGFTILTTDFLDELANYLKGKRVLEVMAGCGSMSKCLQDRGIDIKATDNELWATQDTTMYSEWQNAWTEIESIDVLDAVRKYGDSIDTVILSWPPYKSTLPLKTMKLLNEINPKIEMIYIGEGMYGCTADEEFYRKTNYMYKPEFKRVQDKFIRWKGFEDHINIIELR